MRSIIIILFLALAGLQYKLWIGYGSFVQWRHLEEKISSQKSENNLLFKRNRALEADILELKSGEQALEEQARYELGMVKEGEIYYQVVE